MNAFSTTGQSRIRQRDISDVLLAHRFTAPAHLAALERHRGWQAVAEHERLLEEHGLATPASGSLIAQLRQTFGATLVRAGERLAGASPSTITPEPVGRVGTAT